MSKLISRLERRQSSAHVFVEITRAQLAATLVANGGLGYVEFEAPQGSVLVSGSARVLPAFDGTSPTPDVGDSVDDDRYTSSPVDLTAAASTTFTPAGYLSGAGGNTTTLRLTYSVSRSPTAAGILLLHVGYVRTHREDPAQGNASAPPARQKPGPHRPCSPARGDPRR